MGGGRAGRVPWGPCLSLILTLPVMPEDGPAGVASPAGATEPQGAGVERGPGGEDAEGLLPQGALSSQECEQPEAASSRPPLPPPQPPASLSPARGLHRGLPELVNSPVYPRLSKSSFHNFPILFLHHWELAQRTWS